MSEVFRKRDRERMPYVTVKTEVVPEASSSASTKVAAAAAAATAPKTAATTNILNAAAAAVASSAEMEDPPTMEYRMLPHYWDCVEANEWDWGPKGRPLPVSPKNPRAGAMVMMNQ